jgi:predicted P-loop ATPase
MSSTIADYASAYVSRYNFSLVPLPPKEKRPNVKDWGKHVLNDKAKARAYFDANPDANMGVALGPSRLCSWDIDDEPATRLICEEFGFDLDAMRAATPTIQGQAPGFRMMFRIPDGVDLKYHALTWPKQDGSKGRFTVFELRAADTEQRQDVLPPSIHPDTGKPYIWLTKPNGVIPEPPAWLITIWQQWDKFKPQLQDVCPWAEKRNVELPPQRSSPPAAGGSVIDAYVSATSLLSNLKQYGYKPVGRRWLSPHSQTKLPGVNVFPDDRAWIHHASDPLCSDESGKPVNSFDLFCCYEHGGDVSKAVRAASKLLGMDKPPARPVRSAPPEHIDTETGEITPAGVSPVDWMSILECTKAGPLNNLDNCVRVLEHDPTIRGKIWYDEFLDRIITTWQGAEREWKDQDDLKLQLYLQRYIGLTKISINTAHDAAIVAAFHDIRNECRSYLDGLNWDGVPRLGAMLTEAFGAEDDAYHEAVGRCWFISMVARVFTPGCKVDTVPVLEGTQGRGKSTALSIIGGKWYSECHEQVTSKDFFGVLDGNMIVEISEMHSFTRAEVERIKGVISCQRDRYRKVWGRNTADHPRKTVLACTTNRDDWQRDDTGARRFWPILCHEIDHEWLKTHRDQLFAEAVFLFKEGVSWWEVPAASQAYEVEKRRDVDAWESTIEDWLIGKTRIQTRDILAHCLQIDISKHDQLAQKRVGRVLRVLGWKQHVVRDGGKNVRAWIREA